MIDNIYRRANQKNNSTGSILLFLMATGVCLYFIYLYLKEKSQLPLYFGIFFGIMAFFSLLWLRFCKKEKEREIMEEKNRIDLLKASGVKVMATISSIEELVWRADKEHRVVYNYYLCSYLEEESGKIMIFKSDDVDVYSKKKKKEETCTVYYDQKNPKNYYVDANV